MDGTLPNRARRGCFCAITLKKSHQIFTDCVKTICSSLFTLFDILIFYSISIEINVPAYQVYDIFAYH